MSYPKPDRSDKKPNFKKTAENDSLDIGWHEGVLSDGRPFRLEAWCQDQVTFLTYFFSTIDLEEFTNDELAIWLSAGEGLFEFTSTERSSSAMKWRDAAGNEMWAFTVIVGADDETNIKDHKPLQKYDRSPRIDAVEAARFSAENLDPGDVSLRDLGYIENPQGGPPVMLRTRVLSRRFEDALVFATQLHREQPRKGTTIPYVAHLLAVASIALEHGADEDEAIGALLHDAAEDQGGEPTLKLIRERFGPRVAEIVEGCTDAITIPKPPWRQRKEKYLAHLPHSSASVRLVSASDKLHNARSILSDLHREGEETWTRFNGGKEGTLWYYRALVRAFRAAGNSPLVEELDRVVTEMEKCSG